ncbi:nickel pincer cofactor biosynthesis protein LarB [Budvicia diplopodorum]|uniref:nickel pincer cofactor biosynthesis protein LarB n=1 Tax=Budvicia diplopodorum TaxID=1119056 RepID=UPI001BA5A0B0|nr:nickel pincer cofactor biosynthesis protein LarB [Budvicia diplopodorum]
MSAPDESIPSMPTPDIIMDFGRLQRCGIEEAVFCEFKRSEQIEHILSLAKEKQHRLLLTRLTPEKFVQLSESWIRQLEYNPTAHCAVFGDNVSLAAPTRIGIISGGSSDASVCEEIKTTLNFHGIGCDLHQDIGVAGLWRLQERLPVLRHYAIIIAVAGMEAALPTVISGLVNAPIIAVPTSVGYGIASGGHVALNACLASCAGGVMTMNIDNGYGAAVAAIRIYKQIVG